MWPINRETSVSRICQENKNNLEKKNTKKTSETTFVEIHREKERNNVPKRADVHEYSWSERRKKETTSLFESVFPKRVTFESYVHSMVKVVLDRANMYSELL